MPAKLELELTDAAGNDLNDFVTIDLISAQDSNHFQNNQFVGRKIAIGGITAAGAGTVYRVEIAPSNHRLVQFFQMLSDGQTSNQTVALPVDPGRVTGIQAPGFAELDPDVQQMLATSEIPQFADAGGAF